MAEQPSSALAMLTEFFSGEHLEATARRTGFVQRTSKITGKLFLALITFGHWSDAQTPLAQLAAKATQLGTQVAVSPEALYQRMNKRAEGVSQVLMLCEINCLNSWRFNTLSTPVIHLPGQ
jgi:hypothetical protein